MKRLGVLLLLWAIALASGELCAQKKVFHFRFEKTLEKKAVKDLTGKVEMISPQATNMRIKEIMDLSGFNSLSHFSHVFKKYYGVSPGEYRKTHK